MKNLILISLLTLFSQSVFSQIPNYVPTNGLFGWWPFSGNANDESANTNNGTVNGASLTIDRFGLANEAYSFDGLDDFIEVFQPFLGGANVVTGYTISVWFKMNSLSSSSSSLLLGQSSYWRSHWSEVNSSGQIGFSGENISGYYGATSAIGSITLNTWQNAIAVYDGTTLKIYLNNNLVVNQSVAFSSLDFSIVAAGNSTGRKLFGCASTIGSGLSAYHNGDIDDIGMWNRALTICEINDLYNAQLGSQAISAGPDQTICAGDNVTLNASGGNSYLWNNNVVNGMSFAPTQTATYTLNGTDLLGCSGSDTVMVTVLENAASTLTQTALDSYMLNGQTYTQSGTYTQVVPAANGCDSTITLNLTLNFTGIHELVNSNKILVKITDLNGKIIQRRKNTVMLFIYEDGTVERVVEVE